MSEVKIIAHRGKGPTSHLSGKGSATEDVPSPFVPENTLKAFEQAIMEGADGIEFDIYVSKDGVPVVTHDDELNMNVAGADRKSTNLGLISQKTLEEIKTYDVGQGERIPTLEETVEFFVKHNKERDARGLEPLIMNVELKGQDSAKVTYNLIKKYIDKGVIRNTEVVYCSFEHEELLKIRRLDKQAKISPAIKSKVWFGQENVIKPGWFIPLSAEYNKKAFDILQKLMSNVAPTALDPILFDIDRPLVDFAKEHNIELYASTSNFRDFTNKGFIYLLFNISKEVPVYFKTDEPGIIRSMLEEMKPILDIDLSQVLVLDNREALTFREERLERIPKIGQPEYALKADTNIIEERANKCTVILQKMLLKTSEYLKLYFTNDITKEDATDLGAVMRSFFYLKPYIGKILAIDDAFVSKAIELFEQVANFIEHNDPIPLILRSHIEYFMTELDSKEKESLSKVENSPEIQVKIDNLENHINFYQMDALASYTKVLNGIIIETFSSTENEKALMLNLATLKQIFHIDQLEHNNTNITDSSIQTLLTNLVDQLQHKVCDSHSLQSVIELNQEVISILQEAQNSDSEGLYWSSIINDLSQANNALFDTLGGSSNEL